MSVRPSVRYKVIHGALRPWAMESAGLLVSIVGVPGARHECRVGTLGATVIGSRLLLRDWGTCLAWQLQRKRKRRVSRVEVASGDTSRPTWLGYCFCGAIRGSASSSAGLASPTVRAAWCERLAWRGQGGEGDTCMLPEPSIHRAQHTGGSAVKTIQGAIQRDSEVRAACTEGDGQ